MSDSITGPVPLVSILQTIGVLLLPFAQGRSHGFYEVYKYCMPSFRPNILLLTVGCLTPAKISHCSISSQKTKILQYLSAMLVWDRRWKAKPAVSLLSKTIKSSQKLKWRPNMIPYLLTRFCHCFYHILCVGWTSRKVCRMPEQTWFKALRWCPPETQKGTSCQENFPSKTCSKTNPQADSYGF